MDKRIKVLECSSRGDKRFSALYAKVYVNNVYDTIENHYQKSKLFEDENGLLKQVNHWSEAKGRKPVAFLINGYKFPLSFGVMFYKLLWYKYLKANPELEEVLLEYDDYNDMFEPKNAYCRQVEVIKEYIKGHDGTPYKKEDRGKKLKESCKSLLDVLSRKNTVIILNGDLTISYADVLAHQVNAQGVMGSGVAKSIKTKYPNVYREYMKHPKLKNKSILGECQLIDCDGKVIANLFGQFYYGRNKDTLYTDYKALRGALISLKEFAKANDLSVAMPFKIGCGLANGDWEGVVLPMIKEVFNDYYIILYEF